MQCSPWEPGMHGMPDVVVEQPVIDSQFQGRAHSVAIFSCVCPSPSGAIDGNSGSSKSIDNGSAYDGSQVACDFFRTHSCLVHLDDFFHGKLNPVAISVPVVGVNCVPKFWVVPLRSQLDTESMQTVGDASRSQVHGFCDRERTHAGEVLGNQVIVANRGPFRCTSRTTRPVFVAKFLDRCSMCNRAARFASPLQMATSITTEWIHADILSSVNSNCEIGGVR